MNWNLVWSVVAERDLLTIHWRIAAEIDAAIIHFAATGRGAEWIHDNDGRRLRIRITRADAYLLVDAAERTIYVTRVFGRK